MTRGSKTMRFFRWVAVVVVLAPASLWAQEVVINGKDFETGAADAKLAEIARQAAASGKSLLLSTPPYWQEKASAKLRAGSAAVAVKSNDAFFENVTVRVIDADRSAKVFDASAKSGAPVPAASARAVPRAEPRSAAPLPTGQVRRLDAATVRSRNDDAAPAPPQAAPVMASLSAPTARAAAPEVAPAAAVPVAIATLPQAASTRAIAVPPASPAAPSRANLGLDELRQAFEQQLNIGAHAEGAIKPAQLQKGDELFVRGPVRAVVRRFGSRVQLFWLEGALDVERAELTMTRAGRYKITEPIRETPNPTLRAMHSTPQIFAASVPVEKSPLRIDMERHFNDAKAIDALITPNELRYGDLFYIYRQYAVVFRRTDQGFDRYWLRGEVDLNQAGVIKDGDAYRVVSDRL